MSYHYSPRIVKDGLIFYLDAANSKSYPNGSNWIDLMSSYVGTFQNSPTFSVNNSGGIVFDGIDDFIQFSESNPITGSNPFSLCAWMDVKTHSTYGIALFIGDPTNDNSAYLGYVDGAQVGTSNSIGGGFYGHNWGSGTLTNTGPHYVVFTFLGGSATASIYVDGVLKASEARNPNLSSTAIRIGRTSGGTPYHFNGTLFNCSLYNKALSSSEIQQNYMTTKSRFEL